MTFLLHNIGKKLNENYNTPEEILAAPKDALLTFDGVYQNVFEHRQILLGRKLMLFVTGDYVGKDNAFDAPMPLEKFCTWDEILWMKQELGATIGWHSWTHRDLTKLSHSEIVEEVTPPLPCEDFAYPYGRFNDEVIEVLRLAGYKRAWSVTQGDENNFSLRREYL